MNPIYRILAVTAILAACFIGAAGVTVSRNLHAVSMPDALAGISRELDSIQIAFIYDKLEDYTVTTRFSNLEPYDAVRQIAGFYPVKVSRSNDGRLITVEPTILTRKKISGRIVNSAGEPVEFANVRLFSTSDTTFITGGVSNSNGDFVVPVNADAVILEASCMGYKPLRIPASTGNIGTLQMVLDILNLRDLTVSASGVQFSNDRFVAYPSATQVSHSYDIFTLLGAQPLPGLFVNEMSKSVSAGGGDVLVLVNGVRRGMDYLQLIRPSKVARIEYYTEVPPRWAGGNVVAVLDIILKERNDGGWLYLSPSAALTTGNADIPLGFAYNQGKSQFTLSYTMNWRDYKNKYSRGEESYIAPDFQVDLKQNGYSLPMHYTSHNVSADYTLNIGSNSMLAATFRLNGNNVHNYSESRIYDSQLGEYTRHSSVRNADLAPHIDVYFQTNWKNGARLEAVASGNYNTSDYDRIMADTLAEGAIKRYPSSVHSRTRSVGLNLNYSLPLGKYFTLTIKTNEDYSVTDNNYVLDDFKASYRSNMFWGAISPGYHRGRLNITFSQGVSIYDNRINGAAQTKAFPTEYLRVGYNVLDNLNISVEGRTSATLQSLSNKTAFDQQYDGYLTVTGNPDLKDGRLWQVRPRISFWRGKFTASAWVVYRYMHNWANEIIEYRGDGHFVRYPVSVPSMTDLLPSISFGAREMLGGHITVNCQAGLVRNTVDMPGKRLTNTSWEGSLNIYGYFGRATVNLSLARRAWQLHGTTVMQTENNSYVDCSVNLGKGWRTRASVCFILDDKGAHYRRRYLMPNNPGYNETWIKDNFMMCMVGFRYDFSFGRIFRTGRRSIYGSSVQPDVKVVQ